MDFVDAIVFGGLPMKLQKDTERKMRRLDHMISKRVRRRHASQDERIAELEHALGRVAMLARALAELGLAKGAFTQLELEQALLEADLSDGTGDGRLAGDVALPGEQRAADLEPLDGAP